MGEYAKYGFDQQGWYGMFVACGIWCLADVSSVSPSSEQTVCSDEGLTLETLAKHHIPQATNIPYQPCWSNPYLVVKSFGTTVPCSWIHLLTLIKWRHKWWRHRRKLRNPCVDCEIIGQNSIVIMDIWLNEFMLIWITIASLFDAWLAESAKMCQFPKHISIRKTLIAGRANFGKCQLNKRLYVTVFWLTVVAYSFNYLFQIITSFKLAFKGSWRVTIGTAGSLNFLQKDRFLII